MKKFFVIIFIFIGLTLASQSNAASLASVLKGKILLQTDAHGEAWYVYPNDLKRYFLGRPDDAYTIMRKLGLGATHSFISSNTIFPISVSGKILLDVESHGEAYYINPKDRKKYYLGRPADAFSIMRQLSLGITTANLSLIPVGDINDTAFIYEQKQITVNAETFIIKVATIDLALPSLKIITDTASDNNCTTDCPVKSLADYVAFNNAQVGVNGSYFCSTDYSYCAITKNYFFYPVYNSRLGKMINEDQLKWPTTGPILVFDTSNHPYFFLSTQTFKDVVTFEKTYNTKIQAAISNKPALIYNSVNIINTQELDDKQRTIKSYRSGLGIKNNKVYLVVVTSATVIDLANIMEFLNMEQAINLDGGGSSALYYQGTYRVGPGRNLPNAIIFKK